MRKKPSREEIERAREGVRQFEERVARMKAEHEEKKRRAEAERPRRRRRLFGFL
jgi:hypothetical protein